MAASAAASGMIPCAVSKQHHTPGGLGTGLMHGSRAVHYPTHVCGKTPVGRKRQCAQCGCDVQHRCAVPDINQAPMHFREGHPSCILDVHASRRSSWTVDTSLLPLMCKASVCVHRVHVCVAATAGRAVRCAGSEGSLCTSCHACGTRLHAASRAACRWHC